jgi:sulfur carrier protein ThiS
MARVVFTSALRRHVACPDWETRRGTVREALDEVFAGHPPLRTYILDDQGGLRKHVVVFVDGVPLADPTHLSDTLRDDSEVYVMQALSGG